MNKMKNVIICDQRLCELSDDFAVKRDDEREIIYDFGNQVIYHTYTYLKDGILHRESYATTLVAENDYNVNECEKEIGLDSLFGVACVQSYSVEE